MPYVCWLYERTNLECHLPSVLHTCLFLTLCVCVTAIFSQRL